MCIYFPFKWRALKPRYKNVTNCQYVKDITLNLLLTYYISFYQEIYLAFVSVQWILLSLLPSVRSSVSKFVHPNRFIICSSCSTTMSGIANLLWFVGHILPVCQWTVLRDFQAEIYRCMFTFSVLWKELNLYFVYTAVQRLVCFFFFCVPPPLFQSVCRRIYLLPALITEFQVKM